MQSHYPTYRCIECDEPVEVEEPPGLCEYTGQPHSYSNDPSYAGCDCGASSAVLCDDCQTPTTEEEEETS